MRRLYCAIMGGGALHSVALALAKAHRVIVGTALLDVGGCSIEPAYERPTAPVSPHYPGQSGQREAGGIPGAAGLGRRRYFSDVELHRLIATSPGNNGDLRKAVAQIEESRLANGVRRADQFPTLSAFDAGVRARTLADLSPTGRAMTASECQATLGVTAWKPDLGGE